jgi:hypothetical protein
MSTLHFKATTTSTPQQYVAGLTDFGPGRSKIFPNSADGDPRWSTNEEWLAEWPAIVKTLAALVVVGDEHGRIGIGCWSEIGDAILWRVPVFTLAEHSGELRVADVGRLDVAAEPTPWVAATVRARPISGRRR